MLRTTSILLVLGIGFAIVGCSGGTSTDPATSDSPALTEPTSSEPANSEPAPVATTASFETDAKPIIAAKCVGCHSGAAPKGGLDFTLLATNADATAKVDWLKKMAAEVTAGKMPPAKGAPLTEEEKTKLLAALNAVGG